jgi:Skp family chaperone for outer membrane proteins
MIFLLFFSNLDSMSSVARNFSERKQKILNTRDARSSKQVKGNLHKSIAVVDLKRVAALSNAGKSIEKQIVKINDESKKDLLNLESKIKSMEKSKLAESDSRKIEDMQFILHDMVSTKKYQISEAYRNALNALEKEINKIIAEIASKDNIQFVFTNDAVVYRSEKCDDITEEVIEKINKVCKEITVKVEQ